MGIVMRGGWAALMALIVLLVIAGMAGYACR